MSSCQSRESRTLTSSEDSACQWHPLIAILAVLLLLPLPAVLRAEELRSGQLVVQIGPAGAGLLDSVTFAGREVVKTRPGFVGAGLTLVPAGNGTIDGLFPAAAPLVLPAKIEQIARGDDELNVTGAYTDGKLRVPFTRRLQLRERVLIVTEETDATALDPAYLIASHSLDLPLVTCADEHLRMFGLGGRDRAELFRMDMNDLSRHEQLISAPRGHWPYWDRAGVVQLPGSYRLWKANHADTMAYPLEQGQGAPGWADYSEADWGLTAAVDAPSETAPWAITIDARQGVFSLLPRPGSQPPVTGKDYGKRRFRVQLTLHETSWPAAHPCELDLKLYADLLRSIGNEGGKPTPWVLQWAVGTADLPTIIQRERIQPSVILRTLYRGDAYRMQGRMKSIGQTVPRSQPMEKWESDAREYLDYLRQHGVP